MQKNIVIISSLITSCLTLNGCAENYQSLQSVNQALGNAQRTVDYANTVKQNAPQVNGQVLKNAGTAILQQNPNYQQAQETIRASKALANSVKALKNSQ